MKSKNERVELEMQILKYRNFLLFIQDEKFRKAARERLPSFNRSFAR